jgi:hypothetical protein
MSKYLFTVLIIILIVLSGCSNDVTGAKDIEKPYAATVKILDYDWYYNDLTITEIRYIITNTCTEDIFQGYSFTFKIIAYSTSNYSDASDNVIYEKVKVNLKSPLHPGASYTDNELVLYAPFIKSITVEDLTILDETQ